MYLQYPPELTTKHLDISISTCIFYVVCTTNIYYLQIYLALVLVEVFALDRITTVYKSLAFGVKAQREC